MKIRLALLSLVLISASAFIARASRPEIVPIREPLSGIPMKIGGWEGQQERDMDAQTLAVLGVDDYINRTYYSRDLLPAGLYIGYYESQREGDTIHSPLNCLPGAGWNPVKSGHIFIPLNDNSHVEINRIVIQKGVDKQVVLYWYQSHGRVIASEYWGKIYTVLDAVRTNRTDAALIRIICPVAAKNPEAEIAAEKHAALFAEDLLPILPYYLPF